MALPGLNALTDILHETNRLLSSVLTELQQTNDKRLDETNTRLGETNKLLASVLAQLEETNGARLEEMSAELRDLNQRLGGGATD